MVGLPFIQIILFGFAINFDPKHLPTAVLSADNSIFARSFIRSLENSGYFQVLFEPRTEAEVEHLLASGDAQFVVTIPENFARKLVRGERPVLLLEADATDPIATANAIATFNTLNFTALDRDLNGGLEYLKGKNPPFELRVHRRYNPEGITAYHIVPGLTGVILTMTMVMMTGLAITRERERGTMETLLATPVRPFEVITGKIIPYIIVGYIQVALIMLALWLIFGVPIQGSLVLLSVLVLLFIIANLMVGITFSTLAKNQMQAMQMTFFFFLPSLLLSGFMFPFRGMPEWAQYLGQIFPLTHFLRIVRGILLKGSTLPEILPELWPIALFVVVAATVALIRYRETLD
jgi:ABC-2 type transport system permease protein